MLGSINKKKLTTYIVGIVTILTTLLLFVHRNQHEHDSETGEEDNPKEREYLQRIAEYEKQGIKDTAYANSLLDLMLFYDQNNEHLKAVSFGSKMVKTIKEIYGEKHSFYVALLDNLSFHYYEIGDYSKAIELGEQALEVEREVFGEKHPDYATSLNNLAIYYSDLGDYSKAIELGKQALGVNREVFGEKHPDYTTSLANLAGYYSHLGDYSKAIELGEQALEVEREVLGEKHPDYATSLDNLAGYYSDLGDYSKAIELGKQALEIRKEALGEKHPDYATSLDNLAGYYGEHGDYSKAIELGKQALEIRKEVLGEKHPAYATSLGNLAGYYGVLGDYSKAIELGKQAVEIRKEVLGEKHPVYATSLSNLADYYSNLGDYSKAIELSKQALEIRKEVLGEKHPDYATSLSNLAIYYDEIGNYFEAMKSCQQALEIRKEVLGEKHPDYATSLNNLAIYYSDLGDYSKAIELGKQALEVNREVLGEKHPDYATSLNNLANYYSDLGDYSKAIELNERALEIRKEVLGEKHLDYTSSLNNLAIYYSNLGNFPKSIELCLQVQDIFRDLLGEKHPAYATSLNNLANYYSHLGNDSKAIELGKQAVEIRKEVLGEKHPDYATSLDNLAGYYGDLGDYSKAIELSKQALEIRKEVLGEKHPDYATSLSNLALSYYDNGDCKKAVEYLQEHTSLCQSFITSLFGELMTNLRATYWSQCDFVFTDLYPSYSYYLQKTTLLCNASDLYDKSALFAKGLLLTTEIEMNRLIQESGDKEALNIFEELRSKKQMLQKLYAKPIAERYLNTDSLEHEAEKLEGLLLKRSKVYGDFTHKLRTTWKNVQAALGKDEIAVEFLSFNTNGDSTMVVALTLRKDDKEPKMIPLFEQKQLERVKDKKTFYCQEVTDLVWKPMMAELKDVKRIYFSGAGIIHKVGIEYAPGMENYEIYRLSTTREIIDRKEKKSRKPSSRSSAVLYGGINYETESNTGKESTATQDGRSRGLSVELHRAFIDSLGMRGSVLRYLPGTLDEVNNIQNCFNPRKYDVRILKGKEATEKSVRALSGDAPTILHFATHGFYYTESQRKEQDERRGLRPIGESDIKKHYEDEALNRSGLFMAGANNALKGENNDMWEDDGILTAQEIAKIDLRGVDMVVLSACETAKGDINQGEGVFGLQRGFKKAGAQSIVMSLWKVDDEATEMLMTEFYKNLCAGQDRYEAFHMAQRYVREYRTPNGKQKFKAPSYWAGFIMLD